MPFNIMPPATPIVTKLERFTRLSADDKAALQHASRNTREIRPNRDIISEGDRPGHVHLMLEGWAARYKVIPDGSRQITAYLIPGDFCDLHITILKHMDHGIVALTPATVAFISHEEMRVLTTERPELTRALWWATLVDEGVLRAWIVNIGRRDAYEGISHLMCEMHVRMKNVGLVEDGTFHMPVTQEELADTLGLTPVHVNRVLQRLRSEGLIELSGRMLNILDVGALRKACGFDGGYLHGGSQAPLALHGERGDMLSAD
jgi:CRP-like cAMP-binding protein